MLPSLPALSSMMLLFRVEGIGRPRQISLSPSFFVLSFGIIFVKDEDVVACGNFHLVVIRSGGFASVFAAAAAAAFPSLFRPTKIASHYQNHFSRNDATEDAGWGFGNRDGRIGRDERRGNRFNRTIEGRDFRNRRKWPVFLSGDASDGRTDGRTVTKNDQ